MNAIGRDSTAAAMSSVSGLCNVIARLVFQSVGAPVANNKDGLMQKMRITHDGYLTCSISLRRVLPYTL